MFQGGKKNKSNTKQGICNLYCGDRIAKVQKQIIVSALPEILTLPVSVDLAIKLYIRFQLMLNW